MADQSFTAGELRNLYYRAEATYGVSQTGTLSYAGIIDEFKPIDAYNPDFLQEPGSRSFGSVSHGPYKFGFDVSAFMRKASGGTDWTTFWAYYGLGSATALTDHLDSYTLLVAKKRSTTYWYNKYSGCKFNRFTIKCDKYGQKIKFGGNVMAQFCDYSSSKSFSRIQNITMGDDPSDLTTDLVTWIANPTINIAGGGAVAFKPKNFTITVDHHCQEEEGVVTGYDTVNYPLAAGNGISEGIAEITFECELPYHDDTYVEAKRAMSTITALTLGIDAKTITLGTGYFLDDFPMLKHDIMSDKFRAKFKTITIS